ncbi:MAG TPA: twin-arginine translocase subunit TatB [Gammaproteobacteria bacterium]|nr:twin-arginine translocase subunit TatB [Gammaproteobacteria bacterium]
MFDVGASELLVIAVTALLVVGPDRLPRVARTAGLYLGRARRAVYQLRLDVERELDAEDLARARQIMAQGRLPLESLLDSDAADDSAIRPAGGSAPTRPGSAAAANPELGAEPQPERPPGVAPP